MNLLWIDRENSPKLKIAKNSQVLDSRIYDLLSYNKNESTEEFTNV